MKLYILIILVLIFAVPLSAQTRSKSGTKTSQPAGDKKQKDITDEILEKSGLSTEELSAKEIARRSLPSVALVICDDGNKNYSQGSGFFVEPGVLLTNYHVVEGNKRGIAQIIAGEKKEKQNLRIVSVISYDKEMDLALLSIPEAKALKIPTLPLYAEITPSEIGETVYALGNPEGLSGTISPGIISASLRASQKKARLQITAPISHGSSGGPIVNVYGQVVGVAVGSFEEGQNLNFAVPVNLVKSLISTTRMPTAVDDEILSSKTNSLKDGWFWQESELSSTPAAKTTTAVSVIGPVRVGETKSQASLRKIEGFTINVLDLQGAAKDIFYNSQLQTLVESRLRRYGIKILTEEQWSVSPSAARLILDLGVLKQEVTGVYSYTVDLRANQEVRLDRDSSFLFSAPTWSNGTSGFAGSGVAGRAIPNAVEDIVDSFCKAYLAANQ